MSNKLPTGWIETTLSDVFTFSGGGTPDKKNPLFWGGTIPWVSVKDVKEKYTYRSIDSITQDGVDNSATKIAKEGSVVLITRISPGKTTILRIPAAINQDLKIVNIFQEITAEFVYYLFLSLEKEIVNRSSGTTVLGVNLNQLGSIGFALPPLNEQNRIVSKIEELFSELDAGVENLTKAKEQLGMYRQSLLKHAFEGKLTEEWRKENADKLESGEALLKRVKKEREEYFNKQLEQWDKDITQWEANGKPGKKPTKPRKPKNFDPFSEDELMELPELPEGWVWSRIFDLGEYGRGISKHRPRNDPTLFGGDYPFIQTGEVRNSNGYIKAYSSTYNEEGLSQSKMWPKGTLCITIAANIAETAILTFPACFPDSIVGITPYSCIYPEFLEYYVRTIREELDAYAPATAQKNINLGTLSGVAAPLICEEEQKELISRVGSILEAADLLDAEIEKSFLRATALKSSVLEKAFSGRLVPQSTEGEPASKLLERIKQERKNAPKPTRPKKPKTKTKKVTMADLKEVLASAKDWINAQDAFRQCGVGDGAPTDNVEKLYEELKQQLDLKVIEVERRGDEDWLRLAAEG